MDFPRIPVADVDLSGAERRYLLEAFDSGQISGSGAFVNRFEQAAAAYFDVAHARTCANGTVALHLALLAIGVGPGDEVVVPSLTYIATANAVTYCGATPIFADCDSTTWNISAETVAPLLTERTRAIIPVHLYGNPVDMDPILDLARERRLFVLEDAAEAHGATYKGRRVGALADIATLSFYGNKLMTTGEGGMVLTADGKVADKVALLRGQGMDPSRRYWHPIVGYNYRMTNLQAAIGLAQLERLDLFIETRRELARKYVEALDGLDGIEFQTEQRHGSSVCWLFSIVLREGGHRDSVEEALKEAGIETRPVFLPVHRMPPYSAGDFHCPNAERLGRCALSLPSGGHVRDEDVARVRDVISRVVETAGT